MTAWSELAAENAPYRRDELVAIREAWPEQLDLAAENDKAGAFEGMPDQLAQRLALVGPPEALTGVEAIGPALGRVLERMDPEPRGTDERYAVTVLSMVNALRCGGVRADANDDARERRWLAAIDPVGQSGVRYGRGHAAIAAAGCGLADVAKAAAGEGPELFRAAAVFGCELSPFAAHLAAAQQTNAGPDEVEPAWASFLRNFPGEEAAHTVQWLDLLWAARAVYAVLGRTPVAEVGARLHDHISARPHEEVSG